MTIKRLILFIIAVVVLIVAVNVIAKPSSDIILTVKDFKSCEAAGYPIMESYPRQCRTPEGTVYVEEVKLVEVVATTSATTTLAASTSATTTSTTVTATTTGTSTATAPVLKACVRSGCSGQICSDKEMVSTCEYREVYSCYETAICERQADGQCGWTETEELTACIEEKTEDNTL